MDFIFQWTHCWELLTYQRKIWRLATSMLSQWKRQITNSCLSYRFILEYNIVFPCHKPLSFLYLSFKKRCMCGRKCERQTDMILVLTFGKIIFIFWNEVFRVIMCCYENIKTRKSIIFLLRFNKKVITTLSPNKNFMTHQN